MLMATEETLERVSIRLPADQTEPGRQESSTRKVVAFENLTVGTIEVYRISAEGEEVEHHTILSEQKVRYRVDASIFKESSSLT